MRSWPSRQCPSLAGEPEASDEHPAIHGSPVPLHKNQSRIQIRLVFFILVS